MLIFKFIIGEYEVRTSISHSLPLASLEHSSLSIWQSRLVAASAFWGLSKSFRRDRVLVWSTLGTLPEIQLTRNKSVRDSLLTFAKDRRLVDTNLRNFA